MARGWAVAPIQTRLRTAEMILLRMAKDIAAVLFIWDICPI